MQSEQKETTGQEAPVETNGKPRDPDVLEFRLVRKVKKVKIYASEEDEHGQHCTLREMTGTQRDHWSNEQIKRNKIDPSTGVRTGYDVKDLAALLISYCLYDDRGVPVPLDAIKQYPATVQDGLFEACQRLNALTKFSADEAKKA